MLNSMDFIVGSNGQGIPTIKYYIMDRSRYFSTPTCRTLTQVVVLEQPSSLMLLVLISTLGPVGETCLNSGKLEDVGCYYTEAF